jgi:hypothetical protein
VKHILALICIALPTLGPAATVTFDDGAGSYVDRDGDGENDVYRENGVRVTGFDFELTDGREAAHLDNPSDGHFTDRLAFRTGGYFDLRSFEILPLGFECERAFCAGYRNVVVAGYRAGQRVARAQFSMGETPSLFWGTGFTMLDRLVIRTPDEPLAYQFGNSHFDIDNVVLLASQAPAAVPLPATLPLAGLGLAALGLFGLSRSRKV